MERRWDKVEAERMSRATEGVALGVLHYCMGCTEVGQKREALLYQRREVRACTSEAFSRRVCGPFRSEAALLDQQDSRSIRLVHAWAWWVDETRNCVF